MRHGRDGEELLKRHLLRFLPHDDACVCSGKMVFLRAAKRDTKKTFFFLLFFFLFCLSLGWIWMFLRQRECCFCVCVRVRNDDMKKVIFPRHFFPLEKMAPFFQPLLHTQHLRALSLSFSLFFFSLSLSLEAERYTCARRGDDEGAFSSRKSSLD